MDIIQAGTVEHRGEIALFARSLPQILVRMRDLEKIDARDHFVFAQDGGKNARSLSFVPSSESVIPP